MTTNGADDAADVPAEGEVLTHERIFTVEDVRNFGRITGDEQSIHTEPDAKGRLVVQGLLAGSLMTKIGGDLNYIARTMELEFRQPVRTGESITCECTMESIAEHDDRYLLEIDVDFLNDREETVIDGQSTGLIWKTDS